MDGRTALGILLSGYLQGVCHLLRKYGSLQMSSCQSWVQPGRPACS